MGTALRRIGIVVGIGWASLRRDRLALGLTFVLPVVFFSLFAWMFGGTSGGGTSKVRLAVADLDKGEASQRLIDSLEDHGLRLVRDDPDAEGTPLDRARALTMVEDGDIAVALVIPDQYTEQFGAFDDDGPKLELLADKSDPIAPQLTAGILQGAAMKSMPDLMLGRGLEMFEKFGGPMTSKQREAVDAWVPLLKASAGDDAAGGGSGGDGSDDGGAFAGIVQIDVVDVLGQDRAKKKSPVIAFYAAGTAVMFLLFSMTAAGGTLLEEEESGVLERLLSSRLTMGQLLMGKWVYLSLLGVAQVIVMFVWGAFAFELDLWTPQHFTGFLVMTVATSISAAGFGLILATACRTRAQLGGISTLVILSMSAMGGSMFPRFMMPETMQTLGLLTFNAWALDGYQGVFWYEKSVPELWPQLLVLVLLTVAFLGLSRVLARRWEAI